MGMIEKIYAQPAGYELVEFLGEGLNSCVYRAIKEDAASGVRFQVALKILKSENLVELWRAEFDRLRTVKSKNCVSLLGWEFICNKPALVLEYVKGATLAELCEFESLRSEQLIEISAQALSGLKDLSSAHIFHGDLNMHNIMVDENGVVKLVDFGVIESDEKIMTTPEFASPEVMSGEMPTHASDIYSLRAITTEISRRQNINFQFKLENHKSNCHQQKLLANLVQRYLLNRNNLSGRTQSLARIKKKEWTWPRLVQASIVFIICLTSFISHGDQAKINQLQPLVRLTIRTKDWVKININGQDKGYAPIDLWIESTSKVQLLWQTAQGEGQLALTLSPAKNIVLTDRDFSPVPSQN